jgi:hypothetical protein
MGKYINIYEHFFYGSEDGDNQNVTRGSVSAGASYFSMTPKKFQRELTRASKDALMKISAASWHELGPIIEKINLLCEKYSDILAWNRLMIGSSALSGYNESRQLEYFENVLKTALEMTIFNELRGAGSSKYPAAWNFRK